MTDERKKELLEKAEADGELCNYCSLPDEAKGVHCYGGEPVMCEGRHCEEARKRYLEELEDEE